MGQQCEAMESDEEQQRYIIPNRRAETFDRLTLQDIHQSKYNYALHHLQLRDAGLLHMARLVYTRQAHHYYAGHQAAFYCDARTIQQNRRRHKGLVHVAPLNERAKWRDVAWPGAEARDAIGFACAGAFRADALVECAQAQWPIQTVKSFYHDFLIVDYTAHLRLQLEEKYTRRCAHFIYATTGGNARIREQDWAELYALEVLAYQCAQRARRDFTRATTRCAEGALCEDRTPHHLCTHYHPCAVVPSAEASELNK